MPRPASAAICGRQAPAEHLEMQYDVDTGHHLGNFPQAFSHLALIQAAARIIIAERLEEVS